MAFQKQEGKESQFNSAALSLFRLHELIDTTHHYFATIHRTMNAEDLEALKQQILNIYDELADSLNKKEEEEIDKNIEQIKKMNPVTRVEKNKAGEMVKIIDHKGFYIKLEILRLLRRKLIKLADKYQMLNPKKKSGPSGGRGF